MNDSNSFQNKKQFSEEILENCHTMACFYFWRDRRVHHSHLKILHSSVPGLFGGNIVKAISENPKLLRCGFCDAI